MVEHHHMISAADRGDDARAGNVDAYVIVESNVAAFYRLIFGLGCPDLIGS